MPRPALAFAILLCAAVPVAALVGDAGPADWTIARCTVMVLSSSSQCSGVVLAQDLVLTAAHCVMGRPNFKIVGNVAAKPYQLGEGVEVASHPQFSSETWPTVDLALLKLSKPLPTEFAPVFFGGRSVAVGDRLIVVGYGLTVQGNNQSAGAARMAALIVTDRSENVITVRDAIGGAIGGCGGDSGAPAFATRNGVATLVGVLARGLCGVSSDVILLAPYRDWILETARRFGSPLDR